ncbi:MAG: hypothetical protein WA209_13560 [Candidatus Acidiferrales bacterium]
MAVGGPVWLLIIAFATAMTPASTAAQDLPDKTVVRQWIANARKSTGLSTYTGAPCHFVATFHYTFAEKSIGGMYEVLWAAPNRFRVDFRAGTMGETDVVLGDKKYVLRNTPTMTYAMWSVSDIIVGRPLDPRSPKYHSDDAVHKLKFEPDGSTQRVCADAGDDSAIVHRTCFDAATGAILADHTYKKSASNVASEDMTNERMDFVQLGNTRVARHIVRRTGPETLDISLEKWRPAEQFGADTFVPPAKGVGWDWCASPGINRRGLGGPAAPLLFIPYAPTGKVIRANFASYHIVGADGRIEQSTSLFGTTAQPLAGGALHDRAPIHSCNSKAMRYESISVYWAGMNILGG